MTRKLPGQVVVVTGASSGIGRATAKAFAAEGCHVVLAARRADALNEAAEECRGHGVEALAIPTDVTKEEEVDALARQAVERFGRIDVWFNNACVGVFGKIEDVPSETWKRVIDVNLNGYYYGARAALRQFKAQGHGVLIMNASIVARHGQPDATAYVASKFAVRGLAEGLRQELLDDPGIEVCTVMPAVIDTPFFQHAANYSGHEARAMPPVYAAEQVADVVVGLAESPRPEAFAGGAGRLLAAQKAVAPGLSTWMLGRALNRGMLGDAPAPETSGTVFRPMAEGTGTSGGWRTTATDANTLTTAALALMLVPIGMAAWHYLGGRSQG